LNLDKQTGIEKVGVGRGGDEKEGRQSSK